MSFHGDVYDPTPPDDPGGVITWHAAVMMRDYKIPSEVAAMLPVGVRDDDEGTTPATLMRKDEKGFAGKKAIHPKSKIEMYSTHFQRRGQEFHGT